MENNLQSAWVIGINMAGRFKMEDSEHEIWPTMISTMSTFATYSSTWAKVACKINADFVQDLRHCKINKHN